MRETRSDLGLKDDAVRSEGWFERHLDILLRPFDQRRTGFGQDMTILALDLHKKPHRRGLDTRVQHRRQSS